MSRGYLCIEGLHLLARAMCLYLTMMIYFRYFIFTSFWQYKIYYVFGFMLLVYFILVIVTVCVTIVSTYFLLNAEDYRWYVKTGRV